MSFILPRADHLVAPRSVKEEAPVERERVASGEADRLLVQQEKELENIIRRQQQRIQALQTSATIEIECSEGSRHVQLLTEKRRLETELVQLAEQLDELDVRWGELRQSNGHELQWGEMKSNLSAILPRSNGLQVEIRESQRQLKSIQALANSRRERLGTVRRELQQTRQRVKWLLECQVRDERLFRQSIQEERDFLQQLIDARREMENDMLQLVESGGRENPPLQRDTEVLEVYLEEMQTHTHTLQLRCEEIQQQIEEVRRTAQTLEKTSQPLAHQRALEYVDLRLIRSLNEHLEVARRSSPRGELPLSVKTQKEQWLRNYLSIWIYISQECARLHREAKAGVGASVEEANRRIQRAEQKLCMVTGAQSGDAIERQAAFLFLENLLYLQNQRQKREAELLHQIEAAARSIGESPTSYIALVKTEGYNDVIGEYDVNYTETFMPSEPGAEPFEPMPEEAPEAAIDDMRSSAEFSPDECIDEDMLRKTRQSSCSRLQTFLLQKSSFLNERATQQQLPVRSALSETNPVSSVEDTLRRSLEKLVRSVLGFVKNRRHGILRQQMRLKQDSISADVHYPEEARAMEIKVQRLLSERQRVSLATTSR